MSDTKASNDRMRKLISAHRDMLLTREHIVFFGVTEGAAFAKGVIEELGAHIHCTVDNNPLRQGGMWQGVPIYPPDYLKGLESVLAILCTEHMGEKRQQLKSYGLHDEDILDLVPGRGSFLERGFHLLKCLMTYAKFYQDGKELILCPYPGTGDAYLTGRYLSAWLKKQGLVKEDYKILVTGGAFRKVMEIYGYTDLQLISRKECEQLKILLAYFGGVRLHIRFMLYWGLIWQNIYRIENIKGISFHSLFVRTVFGVEPLEPLPFVNKAGAEDCSCLFSKYKLKPGRTVILAPYANSFVEELPKAWWEELAGELATRGLKVYTNSSGDTEPVIAGTEKIFLSYEEMYRVLETAGYLIGMRSGLFDLMNEAECTKVVIYQEFITKERMNFFSLKNMYGRKDAYEYQLENSENGRLQLKNTILEEVFANGRI